MQPRLGSKLFISLVRPFVGLNIGLMIAMTIVSAGTATPSHADTVPDPVASPTIPTPAPDPTLCFDFTHASGVKPLSAPIPFSSPAHPDTTASGPNPQGGGWGAAHAELAMPIAEVLQLLRDQTTLKDPKKSDLEVIHQTRSGLLDLEDVDITIHPFPLISIHWTEQWAYRLSEGTKREPREALIAYQKTSGTSHIRHFCGNIWLKANGPASTDFAVYEETDATHREATEIAQGHLGTIRTLRAKAAAAKSTADKSGAEKSPGAQSPPAAGPAAQDIK